MKVLGLDLSTSTGVSRFVGDKLQGYSNITSKVDGSYKSKQYPMNYIEMAEDIGLKVAVEIMDFEPDYIVIEETNDGRDRYKQKMLEFIHFAVNKAINNLDKKPLVIYINFSYWKKILGIGMNSDQRIQNRERKIEREQKREEISRKIYNEYHSKIQNRIKGLKKREANKIIKHYDREINKLVGKEMRKFRSKIKAVNSKTLSLNFVNEKFDLMLKNSDNDIADAICVAYAFIVNNYSAIPSK